MWRAVGCLAGSLALAVGAGLAWALLFPSTKANNILFGGMLIPLAWVAAMVWLWFASWQQFAARLVPVAALLYGAVFLAYTNV